MNKPYCTLAAVALSSAFALAVANGQARKPVQIVPGFTVSVKPTVVVNSVDSVAISYVVTLAPTARDSLTSFFVDAPTVRHVVSPGPPLEWVVGSHFRSRRIAEWMKPTHLLRANHSTPPLTYSATGLLDIVRYWAQIDPKLDSVVTEGPDDPALTNDTTVVAEGTTGFTIGVTRFPTDLSALALTLRLSKLLGRTCSLGWIDNQGVCNSLKAKMKPDAGPLHALLDELKAQRGKHVSEAAFLLLSHNASFIIHKL